MLHQQSDPTERACSSTLFENCSIKLLAIKKLIPRSDGVLLNKFKPTRYNPCIANNVKRFCKRYERYERCILIAASRAHKPPYFLSNADTFLSNNCCDNSYCDDDVDVVDNLLLLSLIF
ncbi:hypothetical protein DERP_006015 [Dermatophagoides pteronyssinus]|uniref:Uncharacterized protein n=1 Tax=Dermatophagoides pteronyssinus TaxID=6956 RepID=A0ABQ8JS33_DERPT|nr:hypothetical protein DERP_006015 [Dermatophagoides pteronyssinus]